MTDKSWSKQAVLLANRVPSAEEIRGKIASASTPKNRFILAVMYLTGARVSEIKGLHYDKIWRETIQGKDCFVFKLANLKNKKVKEKYIPVVIEEEPELCQLIKSYYDSTTTDIIIPGSHQRLYQISMEELGYNPHFLRHCRLTHLTVNKKFTELQLTKWAGWTDARPATTYVSMDYTNLV